MKDLFQIISHFHTDGIADDIIPLGNGLINDTYKVITKVDSAPDYVLQRINHDVFQNVGQLQSNIEAVTSHIRKKLERVGEEDIDCKVLRFLKTDSGKTYWFDGKDYWRMMVFISNAKTYETVTPQYSYYAGKAFGHFEAMLSDMSINLYEIIPKFHNMEFRLEQLNDAVKNDTVGRSIYVKSLLDDISSHAYDMCKGERLFRDGKIPKRICHCDTKVNNILFDENGEVLCVIDLDTVMSNFIFSDYGDFLRTAANTGEEDDRNLEHVNFNFEIFKSYTKGYLESMYSVLTPIEIEYLPYAVALFPYMQCVRFLTDYINGDRYYKIAYPEHNLVRTKAQFKLWKSVEKYDSKMRDYINECVHEISQGSIGN